MQQTAEIIQFQRRRMADTEDGWFKLSNTLSEMLCRVQLNGREFRYLHAVIHKTIAFNKASDWIAASQMEKLTGITQSHQSEIKRALVERNILITNGREVALNLEVSDWVISQNYPKTGNRKLPENGVKTTRKRGEVYPKTGKNLPENGVHNKKDTSTKDTNTKDKGLDLSVVPEWLNAKTVSDFVDHRKAVKKPMTQIALTRLIAKLDDFRTRGIDPNACLDESIVNGWQGVFEPKGGAAPRPRHTTPSFDQVDYAKGAEGFERV